MIKGSINVRGEIIINGIFQGNLNATTLTIEKSVYVSGNIHARTVTVLGRIEQQLVATEYLYICESGSLKGDVIYSDINVAKGGKLEGTLTRQHTTLDNAA